MTKAVLLQLIVARLSHDLAIQFNAAKAAHEASTHEENIPDNKYETLALEASYVAQGQANRAQELTQALEAYKRLTLVSFADDAPIRLSALVTLAAGDGSTRRVFIGPHEGGLKIVDRGSEIVIITPGSPLGRRLIGKTVGDLVEMGTGTDRTECEIVGVS